jgi:hypothetical protein
MLGAGEKKKQSLRMPGSSGEHVVAFNKNNLIMPRNCCCQGAVRPRKLIKSYNDYSLRDIRTAHPSIIVEKKVFSATGSMLGIRKVAASKVSCAREDKRWAPISLPRAWWVWAAPI